MFRLSIAVSTALAGVAHAQLAEWDNNAGGLWTDATNWDPMVAPNGGSFIASIALPGTYNVFLNTNRTVGSLSLTNPNASVTVELGDSLTVDTNIINDGLILINSNAGGAVTSLVMGAAVAPLSGTGTLRLNGSSVRAQLLTTAGATVDHGSGHTIEGFGRIDAEMVNNGLINANVTGQTLNVLSQPMTNNSVMRASNSGILDLDGLTISQSASGSVIADGGTVILGGSTVIGGTLDTINAGTFLVDVASAFDGVTVNGDLTIVLGDRIDATSNLINNADLTINSNAGGAVTTLEFQDASTLGGTGTLILNGFSVRSQLIANNGTLTHEAPHTIRGFGRIEGTIDNQSSITADVPGQDIFIQSSTVTNTSVLSATSGGTLDIETSTVTNTGGVIRADNGEVRYANVNLIGGNIDTVNGGASIVDVSSAFTGVTVDGDLIIEIGDVLTVDSGLVNNATLTVNSNAGGAVTSLAFADTSSLSGSGQIILNGFDVRAQLLAAPGQTATIESPQLVRGFGRIEGAFINNSTVSADVANQAINVINSTIENNSVLQSLTDATLDINSSVINNDAGVMRTDSGTVRLSTVTVNGGSVEAINSGLFLIDGGSAFDAVTIEDDLTVEVGDTLAITNGVTNRGTLTINSNAGGAVTNLRFDDDSKLGGDGTVLLNGLGVRARLFGLDGTITATQGSDHTIAGQGQIEVTLINNGTIAPGFPATLPIREMLATTDITNTDSANYVVEVQDNNNSDAIDSSAAYHAAGTLTIEFINGFDPVDYWSTSIIQADGGVTGRYDTIVAPVPSDSRLIVRARYLPDEIRVGAVCKPDIDFNGVINFFDITAFIALFNAQDPDADIAAPFGAWNFFDIATYIGQFNAGCP